MFYTDFDKFANTWKRLSSDELKTFDIDTGLFDSAAAFVRIHGMERFSKDFLEVRGSQLWLI